MATVKAIVRSNRKNAEVNVRFRVSDGRDIQLFHGSDIKVKPDVWDSKNDCIKARVVFNTEKRNEINRAVIARKQLLSDLYEGNKHKTVLTSEVLERLVDETLYPDKYKKPQDNIFELMELFLSKRRLSKVRENNYHVLIRVMKRYELFYQIYNNKPKFNLSVETINSDVIEDFEDYLKMNIYSTINIPRYISKYFRQSTLRVKVASHKKEEIILFVHYSINYEHFLIGVMHKK